MLNRTTQRLLLVGSAAPLLLGSAVGCSRDSDPALAPSTSVTSEALEEEATVSVETTFRDTRKVIPVSTRQMGDWQKFGCWNGRRPGCMEALSAVGERPWDHASILQWIDETQPDYVISDLQYACLMEIEVCAGHRLQAVARSVSRTEFAIEGYVPYPGADGIVSATIGVEPLANTEKTAALQEAFGRYSDSIQLATSAHPAELSGDDERVAFYTTFLDASNESLGLEQIVRQAAFSAADGALAGSGLPEKGLALKWNRKINSQAGIGRFLGFGKTGALKLGISAVGQGGSGPKCGGGDLPTKISPLKVPVCSAITAKEGAKRAVQHARTMGISPVGANGDPALFLSNLVGALNQDLVAAGKIQQPLSNEAALTHLNVTLEDINSAKDYLCNEATVFGALHVEDPSKTVGNIKRYSGMLKPSQPLPAPVIASLFLGSSNALNADISKPNTEAYGSSGAIRKLDQARSLAAAFSGAEGIPAELTGALVSLRSALDGAVGTRRLEFFIGSKSNPQADDTGVNAVQILIHGLPYDGPVPTVWLAQGLDGLRFATDGAVPGANSGKIRQISGWTPVTETMTDLGKTVTFDSGQLPQIGGGISANDMLYVVLETEGRKEVLGGIDPKPADTLLSGSASWTRHVVFPIGGLLHTELGKAMAPSSDDCSKSADTCAGLRNDLWPPLESEINGGTTNAAYDGSMSHYLEFAKSAADEADRMGLDLIAQGLTMDEKAKVNEDNLLELCGPQGAKTGCQNIMAKDYVTLGSQELCLWKKDGQICKGFIGSTVSKDCPFRPSPGQTCEIAVGARAGTATNVEAITVHPLKIVGDFAGKPGEFPETSDAPDQGVCKIFDRLRTEENMDPSAREAAIRQIASKFPWTQIVNVVASLVYEEGFADNYKLSSGDMVVFDTKRHGRPSKNSAVSPPCNLDAKDSTGSSFWSQKIDCFVSGENTNCGSPGVGLDGCPDDSNSSLSIKHSLDTEQQALRNRWAWGFGHLRRSMAVLGAMTGKMKGNMHVAAVYAGGCADAASTSNAEPGYQNHGVYTHEAQGWPCTADSSDPDSEPAWVLHCKPFNKADIRGARCVDPVIAQDLDGDPYRQNAGRPVNVNGFILNRIPHCGIDPEIQYNRPWGGSLDASMRLDFPTAGVDPQMVYCGMPDPLQDFNDPSGWNTGSFVAVSNHLSAFLGFSFSSGWVGSSVIGPVAFEHAGTWPSEVQKMWLLPAEPGFCNNGEIEKPDGAFWRALCVKPDNVAFDTLKEDTQFKTKGILNSGVVYKTGAEVRQWLMPNQVNDSRRYNQYLLDYSNGDFQYPLTARNIFDALELACHADRSSNVPAKCDGLEPQGAATEDLRAVSDYLTCTSNRMNQVAAQYVAGPVPPAVWQAFKNQMPIASTSGLWGQALTAMSGEYTALSGIMLGFSHISDASQALASATKQLGNQKDINEAELSELQWRRAAAALEGAVKVLDELAQAGNGLDAMFSVGMSTATHAAAAAAQAAATVCNDKANSLGIEIASLKGDSAIRIIVQQMIDEMHRIRDAANDMLLQMNNLTVAAANLELVTAKAAREVGGTNSADYIDGNPQYTNTVNRRTYNTRLIRYERARDRAKQAAFIARRAIELRFGVDLQQMTTPMTLVEAPQKWASSLCDMQGIDYAKIRTASDAGVPSFSFDDAGASGDSYEAAFIGDYVRKLEDFVRSYPFDYPLKDGDDIAVLSLSDDIYRVTGTCTRPSDNRLYYSGEFDKRSTPTVIPTTKGWYVSGCGFKVPAQEPNVGSSDAGPYADVNVPDASLPQAQEQDWTGCVEAVRQEVVPVSFFGGEIPAQAAVYKLRNAACVVNTAPDAGPQPKCPTLLSGESYGVKGVLAQDLPSLKRGTYQASLYVKNEAPYAVLADGALRVVRRKDGATVASGPIAAQNNWTRPSISFQAEDNEEYRLEIQPPPAADAGALPTIFVAAAQVEFAPTDTAGQIASPAVWQSTGLELTAPAPVCHQSGGSDLRKRFTYKCEYICPDGIKSKCTMNTPGVSAQKCFYEATFNLALEDIETGSKIPSGQVAIGNFNFRHNLAGINLTGTGVTDCSDVEGASCYGNGFVEYSLIHSGDTVIRNYEGGSLPAHMDTAFIEHGKALASERTVTNPPSSSDNQLMEAYMKGEFKGRPMQGLYTVRIWDSPSLRWDRIEDIQLVWKYHYWTRFQK